VDNSLNTKGVGAGARIILEGSNDMLMEKSLHFSFKTSNNQIEYEALKVGLSLARELEKPKLYAEHIPNSLSATLLRSIRWITHFYFNIIS